MESQCVCGILLSDDVDKVISGKISVGSSLRL